MKEGKRIVQEMNVETKDGRRRKGMCTLLKERGLWRNGLVADCKACSQEKTRGFKGDVDSARTGCCMRRILAMQADFKEQRSRLQEIVEAAGHKCIFLP